MSDKIAEIRKRHEQSEKNYIELESTWKAQIHEDRSFLLAEIERLRADRRERIATAALNGLIANAVVAHTPAQFALAAVVVADALIAELDKEGGKP
jgi:hypothetical protein